MEWVFVSLYYKVNFYKFAKSFFLLRMLLNFNIDLTR